MARRVARTPIWVWPVLLALVAGLAGVTGWAFYGPERSPEGVGFAEQKAEPDEANGAAIPDARLQQGFGYYVWVKRIELDERMPNGKRWDSGNDSAPDIQFELMQDGERVHRSPARKDGYIARWDAVGIDVKDMLASGSTQIDPAGLITLPLIAYQPGTVLELSVWDDDATGMDDEQAGVFKLVLGEMRVGDNVFTPSAEGVSSIKQLTVVLVPEDLSMAELLQLVSAR